MEEENPNITSPAGGGDPPPENRNSNPAPPGEENKQTDIDKIVQSAVDRATQKLGTENKNLREEIQKLRTANMSENEKHEAELADREAKIAEREQAFQTAQNRSYAMTALKNAGLDDGGTTVIELIDLVMGEDEKAIDKRVASLGTLVKKLVASEVDKTFKANGRIPGKGDGSDKENKSSVAKELGKRTAEAAEKSRSILDMYTGGKKK